MKKLVCLALALFVFAGCSSKPAATQKPPAPTHNTPASSSKSAAQSDPVSSEAEAETETHEPVLSLDFYEELVDWFIHFGFPTFTQPSEVSFGDSSFADMWLAYYLTWVEKLANDDGHSTRFNLTQYDTGQEMYEIPADIYGEAFEAWFQLECDVNALPAKSDDFQPLCYDAATHTVYVVIEGLGWSGPIGTENPVLVSVEDNIVTVNVDVVGLEEMGDISESKLSTNTVKLRENEDQTYTLLAYTSVEE